MRSIELKIGSPCFQFVGARHSLNGCQRHRGSIRTSAAQLTGPCLKRSINETKKRNACCLPCLESGRGTVIDPVVVAVLASADTNTRLF